MRHPRVQRQARRLSTHAPLRYDHLHAAQHDKHRPHSLFLALCLVVPMITISMYLTDTDVSVPRISLATVTEDAPRGKNAAELQTRQRHGGNATRDSPRRNETSHTSRGETIDHDERQVDVLAEPDPPAAPIFVPEDVNNPTRVPVPPDGFPPPTLPPTHRNAPLLQSIRQISALTPRWPKHPGMHAVELRSYGPAYSSIIVSEKLKVIYVPVFKVGTTSMMYNIAYLENNPFIMNQQLLDPGQRDFHLHEMGGPAWQNHTIYSRSTELIRKVFEDPEYLKFGFVRNPYDRVISAYLDKVAQFGPESKEYQKQMHGLYGDDLQMRKLRNETKPSFREYLQAIEKVLKQPRTKSTDFWTKDAYEDNNGRRDLHWRPQVELLHPDLIHLDYVGRFESLDVDRDVVLNWMYQHTDRRMPESKLRRMHSTDPAHKIHLYDDLRNDPQLKNMLVRIYEQDFKCFHISTDVPQPRTPDT